MKLILFVSVITLLFVSCAAQFFVIEQDLPIVETGGRLSEIILISNPPKNKAKLAALIEMYNRQTISYAELMNYGVHRRFYRETLSLTRNFERGAPYNVFGIFYDKDLGQQTGNHVEASLGSSFYFIDDGGKLIYDITLYSEDIVFRSTNDLENYFLKK